MPETRPNILLIHSDQHRHDCLGVSGHPLLQTPHLDRLASEGMRFTHAFCPIPLCTPARASFLTGAWPWRHASIANWDTEAPRPMRRDLPTWSGELHAAGYGLDYLGKWHVDPDHDPTAFGFDRYVPESDYDRWRNQQGLPPVPQGNGCPRPILTPPSPGGAPYGAPQVNAEEEEEGEE